MAMTVWNESLCNAIEEIKQSTEKKMKKTAQPAKRNIFQRNKYTILINETKTLSMIQEELEKGKTSPLLLSPSTRKRDGRKIGVAERNETERKLVYKTLKNYKRFENFGEIHL